MLRTNPSSRTSSALLLELFAGHYAMLFDLNDAGRTIFDTADSIYLSLPCSLPGSRYSQFGEAVSQSWTLSIRLSDGKDFADVIYDLTQGPRIICTVHHGSVDRSAFDVQMIRALSDIYHGSDEQYFAYEGTGHTILVCNLKTCQSYPIRSLRAMASGLKFSPTKKELALSVNVREPPTFDQSSEIWRVGFDASSAMDPRPIWIGNNCLVQGIEYHRNGTHFLSHYYDTSSRQSWVDIVNLESNVKMAHILVPSDSFVSFQRISDLRITVPTSRPYSEPDRAWADTLPYDDHVVYSPCGRYLLTPFTGSNKIIGVYRLPEVRHCHDISTKFPIMKLWFC